MKKVYNEKGEELDLKNLVLDIIRENLSIEISEETEVNYESQRSSAISIKLMLGKEEISECSDIIYM